MKNKKYLIAALKVTEEARYKVGIMEFVTHFFDYWLFKQTGLYPPSYVPDDEINTLFMSLSNHLAEGVREAVESDVLGQFLGECQFEKRGRNFYSTPESISKILSAITIGNGGQSEPMSYYEPCAGTGVNAINWFLEMQGKGYSVKNLSMYLEDIDPVMVKACFMQLLFYFESIDEWPRLISIQCIDSLTRRHHGLAYVGEGCEREYVV